MPKSIMPDDEDRLVDTHEAARLLGLKEGTLRKQRVYGGGCHFHKLSRTVRYMPDDRRYPRAAAEAVRGFLMLRFGLHLGLRQKNLRQLMICLPGTQPRSERMLETMKRGELRWSERDRGWEVSIPSVAFKNADSSFFGKKPFRLLLPDLDGLYAHIDAYLGAHRRLLLTGADDPGTFFVKSVKRSSAEAWRFGGAFGDPLLMAARPLRHEGTTRRYNGDAALRWRSGGRSSQGRATGSGPSPDSGTAVPGGIAPPFLSG